MSSATNTRTFLESLINGRHGNEIFGVMLSRSTLPSEVVQRALALQAVGRHLLLAGDPVAAGEVIAAPSAGKLDAIAVCLLDVNAAAQATRLTRRGDDLRLLADHQAFAGWMRAYAQDPNHMPHVLSTNGWESMRWERLRALDPQRGTRGVHVLDTSALTTDEVAGEILAWCRRALRALNLAWTASCVDAAYSSTPALCATSAEFDESLEMFGRAIAEFPDSPSLPVFKALTLHASDRPNAGFAILLNTIADHLESPEIARYEASIRANAEYVDGLGDDSHPRT